MSTIPLSALKALPSSPLRVALLPFLRHTPQLKPHRRIPVGVIAMTVETVVDAASGADAMTVTTAEIVASAGFRADSHPRLRSTV